jgi:hypothetical protein
VDWGLVLLIGSVASVVLWRVAVSQGRLRGMREAMQELSRGVSSQYELDDRPLPEHLAKRIDHTKAAFAKGTGTQEKINVLSIRLSELAHEMRLAALHDGFEAGQRWVEPREGGDPDRSDDQGVGEHRMASSLRVRTHDVGHRHVIHIQ